MSRQRNRGMLGSGGGSSVNPWEGGFQPGNSGLLPTPGGRNLLSQLVASPEAQLAVANNLLSTLLQPSLQQVTQQCLPSILNVNTRSVPGRGYNSNSGFSEDNDRRNRNHRNRSPIRSSSAKRPRERDTPPKPRRSPERRNRDRRKSDDKSETAEKRRGADFEGIAKKAFYCHVCKKNMWDAKSFDNHVHGVAHQQMMTEREKGYKVRADLLRQQVKFDEQKHEIERDRLIRLGKKVYAGRKEYCRMCDIHFVGDLKAHRKSASHLDLKEFLHPRCNTCKKEFPMRIELDHHYLTPDHLRKEQVRREGENKKTAEAEKVLEPEVTEIPEKFDPEVAVGTEHVVKVTGDYCNVCEKFFRTKDENHCRTEEHFNNTVEYMKQKQVNVSVTVEDSFKRETDPEATDIQELETKEDDEDQTLALKEEISSEMEDEEFLNNPDQDQEDLNDDNSNEKSASDDPQHESLMDDVLMAISNTDECNSTAMQIDDVLDTSNTLKMPEVEIIDDSSEKKAAVTGIQNTPRPAVARRGARRGRKI